MFMVFDNNLPVAQMPELDADAEMIWTRFQCKGSTFVPFIEPQVLTQALSLSYNSLYRG